MYGLEVLDRAEVGKVQSELSITRSLVVSIVAGWLVSEAVVVVMQTVGRLNDAGQRYVYRSVGNVEEG